MTTIRTLDMPLLRAKTMAQAVLPHVSNDDVTPVLTVANVAGEYLVGTDRYSVGRYRLQGDGGGKPDPAAVHRTIADGGISREQYEDRLADWKRRHLVTMEENGVSVTAFEADFFIPRGALQRVATLGKQHLLWMPEEARVRFVAEGTNASGKPEPGDENPILRLEVWERRGAGDAVTLMQVWLNVRGNYPPVHRLLDEWEPDDSGQARFGLMPDNLAKVTRFAGRHEPIVLLAGKDKRVGSKSKLGPLKVEVGADFVALLQPTLLLR